MRVAINGFGRIGRCFLRAVLEINAKDIEIVAINTPGDKQTCAHLLKYDSVHGIFGFDVNAHKEGIDIDGKIIKITHHRNIKDLNWQKDNIDFIVECSGIFNKHAKAIEHVKQGAKKVLVSAPVEDADATIVYGVNNQVLQKTDLVVSVGSCTTNCLGPILHVLHNKFGVKSAFMTTVHSYTNDQNVVDNNHKKDMSRARACGLSMIPTTTGAAKTIDKIIPELKGRIDGTAIRVPTPNVSLVDLVANLNADVTKELINLEFEAASNSYLKSVVEFCDKPLVSIDFNHNSSSAIFDCAATHVIEKSLVRIAAWYDNEWGFCGRMIDVLRLLAL